MWNSIPSLIINDANNFIAKYYIGNFVSQLSKTATWPSKLVVLVNILKQRTSRNVFIIENPVVNERCLSMTNMIPSLTWAGTLSLSFRFAQNLQSRQTVRTLIQPIIPAFESQGIQSIYMVSKRSKENMFSI